MDKQRDKRTDGNTVRRENYEAEKWSAKWGRDFMTTNGDSVQPMLLGIVMRCQNQKMNAKSVSV